MTEDLIVEKDGAVGRIRLNRPNALHALNTAMCEGVLEALEAWRDDDAVRVVTIDHAPSPDGDPKGARGFCAGGDIRMLAESGAKDGAEARAFFHTEYRMNHRLFTYAKDIVAFMDGITMGGGVGISQPCRYRVATGNTRLAMPETGIGLFPDVGGGWYLSRLPGRIGQYLALTGHRLDGAECLALGLATHYLPAERLPEAKARIAEGPQAVLDSLALAAPEAAILARRAEIDRLFASDRLEDIFAALAADDSDFARETLAILKTKSPQTMKVSLKLLRDGKAMPTFEDEMRQEYAVGSRVVQRHDFLEGVRAVIVDKDNAPKWNPPTPEGVSDHLIDQIFAPLPDAEAWTPY
ncbi:MULTISPECIES: enoyl-CoA hydratase/isomerase family protein [unclassified Sphingomonas]|uniref:enoyl-CoA hydratase/isomerase family protein n=1 Tax=unclassified Sphingomonas TaxID=196159 RepID=UPI0009294685|nr:MULTISPECIES: enoyl-CoA hydratase/isomerase family protein [unclassified Sphingomonas]MBN8848741.1 enoyl-CoA hydratase/isomerase family protein [Sphingomonas sp.]OJV33395.1 MAG: enoyl-CoA hydratase [Sphingomonas sp. 67-36]